MWEKSRCRHRQLCPPLLSVLENMIREKEEGGKRERGKKCLGEEDGKEKETIRSGAGVKREKII